MCNAWDTTPSDGQPEIEAKPPAKVLSIGSFCPAWDAERKVRNAQQQLAHDLAMVGIHSSDAGKPDGDAA